MFSFVTCNSKNLSLTKRKLVELEKKYEKLLKLKLSKSLSKNDQKQLLKQTIIKKVDIKKLKERVDVLEESYHYYKLRFSLMRSFLKNTKNFSL